MQITKLYSNRFNEKERQKKNNLWKILCNSFLQRYIPPDSVVLDIGAGYCEFINNIKCAKKYAVDLNGDTFKSANPDVKVFNYASTDLSVLPDNFIDVVFTSNFFEHLKTKEEVIDTLSEVCRILKSGGKIMILQPNIRYLYSEYWDFFDHYIPLSDRSMAEVLQMTGFSIEKVLPKFLPYTTKGKLIHSPFLLRLYLAMPFIWWILGKQMFILARKK